MADVYDIAIEVEFSGVWPDHCEYPIIWEFHGIDKQGGLHDLRAYMDVYTMEMLSMRCEEYRNRDVPFRIQTSAFMVEADVSCEADCERGIPEALYPVDTRCVWTNTRGDKVDLTAFVYGNSFQEAIDAEFEKHLEDIAEYGDYDG